MQIMGNYLPMKLIDYLRTHHISPRDFKKKIGVDSLNTIYRYMRGERIPRADIMERIVEATGGAVQPNDFFTRQ